MSNYLFQANRLPWSEIRKIRNESGGVIRDYYRLRHSYDERDLLTLGSRIERRVKLLLATEEAYSEAMKLAHSYINRHVPEFVQLDQWIAEARRAFPKGDKTVQNAIRDAKTNRPVITSWISNYAPGGAKTGELVSEAMDIAVSAIHVDRHLYKLLLRPVFEISSVSRVAFLAMDSRSKVFKE